MSDAKKPGSSLDDLKARLGLDSVLKKAPQKADEGESTAATDKAAAPSPDLQSIHDTTPPPPGSAVAPSVEMSPTSADYASAVQTFEDPVAGEGEPDPVISGSSMAVDPRLRTPIASSARWALIGATVGGLLLALAVGFGFGKVMRDREVANSVVDEATELLVTVEPVAESLSTFQAALAGYGNIYSEELHQLFSDTFLPDAPVINSQVVSESRILMTTGDDVATRILDYSLETQILAKLVQHHFNQTAVDFERIIEQLSGEAEAEQAYGIFFDNLDLGTTYSNFLEDPEANPYTPPLARIVTYDGLEMTEVPGEDDTVRFYYTVQLPGGQEGQVDIFNLLRISADQLIENTNEETALDRYAARVAGIRARLTEVVVIQEGLIQLLNERAGESRSFAF